MKPAPRKLTPDEVLSIRDSVRLREELRQRANRLSNASLAERFGVHQRTIENVISGYTWGWLQ